MFTKLKKKIAAATTALLFLQVALLGVAVNPVTVMAAEKSYTLTTKGEAGNFNLLENKVSDGVNNVLADNKDNPINDLDYFSDKNYSPILVTLNKVDGKPSYTNKVRIAATKIPGIQIWAPDALGNWYDVNEMGYGEDSGELADNFVGAEKTVPVYVVSPTEKNLTITFDLVDILNHTVVATGDAKVAVVSPYALKGVGSKINVSKSLENKVNDGVNNVLADKDKNPIKDPTYFATKKYSSVNITLNKVDKTADYSGKVRVSATEVPGIQIWAPDASGNWYDVNEMGYGEPEGTLASSFVGKTVPVYVVSPTEIDLSVTFDLVDVLNQTVIATGNVNLDGTAPVVTVVPIKVPVKDPKVATNFVVNVNEAATIDPASFTFAKDDEAKTIINPKNAEDVVVVAPNGVVKNSFKVTLPADLFDTDGTVKMSFNVTDLAGNVTVVPVDVLVDTKAPAAVTNLVASVTADGEVVLTWTNPSQNDYAGIKVLRDGAYLITLDKTATTFVDTQAEKGKTYSYSIVPFDEAGNVPAPNYSVSINVPAPVAPANQVASAAVSDSGAAVKKAPEESKEVKSETDDKKADEKAEGFPLWGIVLLIILAGVGGYLFLNQRGDLTSYVSKATPLGRDRKDKVKTTIKK